MRFFHGSHGDQSGAPEIVARATGVPASAEKVSARFYGNGSAGGQSEASPSQS